MSPESVEKERIWSSGMLQTRKNEKISKYEDRC